MNSNVVKQSFEARLKRRALSRPDLYAKFNTSKYDNDRLNKLLTRLRDVNFWQWDIEHKGKDCCFNHVIGLPEKDGEQKPLFAYERPIVEALQQGKHMWIKKATG